MWRNTRDGGHGDKLLGGKTEEERKWRVERADGIEGGIRLELEHAPDDSMVGGVEAGRASTPQRLEDVLHRILRAGADQQRQVPPHRVRPLGVAAATCLVAAIILGLLRLLRLLRQRRRRPSVHSPLALRRIERRGAETGERGFC